MSSKYHQLTAILDVAITKYLKECNTEKSMILMETQFDLWDETVGFNPNDYTIENIEIAIKKIRECRTRLLTINMGLY